MLNETKPKKRKCVLFNPQNEKCVFFSSQNMSWLLWYSLTVYWSTCFWSFMWFLFLWSCLCLLFILSLIITFISLFFLAEIRKHDTKEKSHWDEWTEKSEWDKYTPAEIGLFEQCCTIWTGAKLSHLLHILITLLHVNIEKGAKECDQ